MVPFVGPARSSVSVDRKHRRESGICKTKVEPSAARGIGDQTERSPFVTFVSGVLLLGLKLRAFNAFARGLSASGLTDMLSQTAADRAELKAQTSAIRRAPLPGEAGEGLPVYA